MYKKLFQSFISIILTAEMLLSFIPAVSAFADYEEQGSDYVLTMPVDYSAWTGDAVLAEFLRLYNAGDEAALDAFLCALSDQQMIQLQEDYAAQAASTQQEDYSVSAASLQPEDGYLTEAQLCEQLSTNTSVFLSNTITLTSDLTIPEHVYFNISENGALIVPAGISLVNNGNIDLKGKLTVNGSFTQNSNRGYVTCSPDALGGHTAFTNIPTSDLSCYYHIYTQNDISNLISTAQNYKSVSIQIEPGCSANISQNIVIPANTIIYNYGTFTIPNAFSLTNNGKIILDSASATLEIEGTLTNNNTIQNTVGAQITGTANLSGRPPVSSDLPTALTSAELKEYLAIYPVVCVNTPITIEEDMTVISSIRLVSGGVLTVPAGKTLTINGSIDLQGGVFDLDGSFISDQSSVFFLYPEYYQDPSIAAPNVSSNLINVSYTVSSAEELAAALSIPWNGDFSVTVKEEVTVSSPLTVPRNCKLHINKALTLASGGSITNYGDISLDGFNTTPTIAVQSGATLENCGTIRMNKGYISELSGALSTTGDIYATAMQGDHAWLANIAPSVKADMRLLMNTSAATLSADLGLSDGFKQAELFLSYENVSITDAVTVPKNTTLSITGGNFTLTHSANLTNNGTIIIMDSSGAVFDAREGILTNNGFIRGFYLHNGSSDIIPSQEFVTVGHSVSLAIQPAVSGTVTWGIPDDLSSYATIDASGVLTVTAMPPDKVVRAIASTSDGAVMVSYGIPVYYPTESVEIMREGTTENLNGKEVIVDVRTFTDSISFTAFCNNHDGLTPNKVNWSIPDFIFGNITDKDNYKITLRNPLIGDDKYKVYDLTATAIDDSSKSAHVKLIFTVGDSYVDFSINGPQQVVYGKSAKYSVVFKPNATHSADDIIWKLRDEDSAYASIDAAGTLTAAKNIEQNHTVIIRACLKADPSVYAEFSVILSKDIISNDNNSNGGSTGGGSTGGGSTGGGSTGGSSTGGGSTGGSTSKPTSTAKPKEIGNTAETIAPLLNINSKEYKEYQEKIKKINDLKPEAMPQLYTGSNFSGICNVSAYTTLINRLVAYKYGIKQESDPEWAAREGKMDPVGKNADTSVMDHLKEGNYSVTPEEIFRAFSSNKNITNFNLKKDTKDNKTAYVYKTSTVSMTANFTVKHYVNDVLRNFNIVRNDGIAIGNKNKYLSDAENNYLISPIKEAKLDENGKPIKDEKGKIKTKTTGGKNRLGATEYDIVKQLNEHPEGIEFYVKTEKGGQHHVVISHYTVDNNGKIQFYVVDPVQVRNGKSTPQKLEDCWIYTKYLNHPISEVLKDPTVAETSSKNSKGKTTYKNATITSMWFSTISVK